MRLRCGKVYSHRYFANLDRLRNPRLIKVKSEFKVNTANMTQTNVTVVTHSNIQPFAGYVKGTLPQSVECFIDSVSAHLLSRKIEDDESSYIEACSFLDFSKGDIQEWARTFSFKVCKTWTDLKKLLRQAYASEVVVDEVMSFRSIIKLADRDGRSAVRCAADISDRLVEFGDKLKDSCWTEGPDEDDKYNIPLEKFLHLMQLTLLTAALPDRLVALFDEPLDENDTELTVIEQIRKQAMKLTDLDPSILAPSQDKPKSSPSTNIAPVMPRSRFQSGPTHTNYNKHCMNCGRNGHFTRDCRANFCHIHNTNNHKFMYCRARKGKQQQQQQSNQSSRSFQSQRYNNQQHARSFNSSSQSSQNQQYKKHADSSKYKSSKIAPVNTDVPSSSKQSGSNFHNPNANQAPT